MTVLCKLFEIITTRNLQLLTSSKLLTVTISEGKRERDFIPTEIEFLISFLQKQPPADVFQNRCP